jgi:hypothetical protein
MERGDFVYHINEPFRLLKVVSPASKNGGKQIICEAVEGLTIYIVSGAPEYFHHAAS